MDTSSVINSRFQSSYTKVQCFEKAKHTLKSAAESARRKDLVTVYQHLINTYNLIISEPHK
jgi:hypothetical protein